MARKLRIAAIIVAAAAAVVVVLLVAAYFAMQRIEPFYAEAIQLEPQAAEQGSRETESRAAALYNDARKPGQWQATFSDDQVNGWMAIQLAGDSDRALSEDVSDPRVAFGDGTISLGFRTRQGGVDTVVAVDAAVHLTENDEVAVRFTSVRAGALPLPVMQVAGKLAAACRELDLPVRWTQVDGLPVALVDVSSTADSKGRRVRLDAIELADGRLLVAGRTEEMEDAPQMADDAATRVEISD
jgi:hypothetical protein